MRAKEFLTEQDLAKVHDALDIAKYSLPYTYMIPELSNQDFYPIYRFGIAIADVRGEGGSENDQNKFKPKFEKQSAWGGEDQVVSSFDPNIGKVIDKALSKIGKHGKKEVSTPGSEELPGTLTTSPVKAFKGYE